MRKDGSEGVPRETKMPGGSRGELLLRRKDPSTKAQNHREKKQPRLSTDDSIEKGGGKTMAVGRCFK